VDNLGDFYWFNINFNIINQVVISRLYYDNKKAITVMYSCCAIILETTSSMYYINKQACACLHTSILLLL